MKYYSTNRNCPAVDFKQATISGQPPDKGLYFPENIPVFPTTFFEQLDKLPREEIAFTVIRPYVGGVIPDNELMEIVRQTINFPIPLVRVTDDIYSLELFHGPTLAFKDVGARFMSRCLGYFRRGEDKKLTVLVATSGDTGGAVADGFHNVDGINVVILYPSGKVSEVQEKQLTALGGNITALEVEGSFDDCQRMVKQAFADQDLNKKVYLTSANSINVARWLPQQFYYYFAMSQWPYEEPPAISVPSGNFGNICAGLMSKAGGLPVAHFIAACNLNNVVKRYLETGKYETRQTIATLSNAMDVGDPSNFIRILEIFENEFRLLSQNLSAFSYSDAETISTIKKVQQDYNYMTDPHGAIGYRALKDWLDGKGMGKGIFLETAHPVKFPQALENINIKIEIPPAVKKLMEAEKKSIKIPATYENLKDWLSGASQMV